MPLGHFTVTELKADNVSTAPRRPLLQSIVYIFSILLALSPYASWISPKMPEMLF